MFDRRSFLAAVAGGIAAAAVATQAEAAPMVMGPATPAGEMPRTVSGLRQGLAAAAAEPREMQYYYYRRPHYARRYYARPGRMVRRCWWNGYARVCRWVRVW
jgi:hypothetical protein